MAETLSAAQPVEARSLSSITSIAANPPAYPRNPTQARLDRLVLYIVKVPGSQDVVLTPLKPPTRTNISSEAVNSSLFYLHVASEADELVLRSIEIEREQQQADSTQVDHGPASHLPTETRSRLNDFHRKPVAGTAESLPPPPPPHRENVEGLNAQKGLPVFPDLEPSGAPFSHNQRPGRNEVSDHPAGALSGRNDNPKQFTIPRRPVTSSDGITTSATGLNPTSPALQQTNDPYAYNKTRPSIEHTQARASLDAERPYLAREWQSNITEKMSSLAITSQNPSHPFRITVIRRDPASGNQWNVGTISSSEANQGTIHVEISNPGYAKFINNEPLSLATMGQNLLNTSSGERSAEALKKIAHNIPHNDSDTTFHRDVVPIRHGHVHNHRHSRAEVFHRRSGSSDMKMADMVNATGGRGYYSFTSPWNGTCSFVASVNGRSIKCKHTIPSPTNVGGLHESHTAEVTVSELRFNIPFPLEQTFRAPLTSVSNAVKEKGKRGALAHVITSNLQKVQHARSRSRSGSNPGPLPVVPLNSSSDEHSPLTADEERLDLSLARELGGGGMSGKSAKLGKLIIEDEGIKMIDLVVAASMGVWWRSSHRST